MKHNVILISACLCGYNCTYRGDNNLHPVFVRLYREGKAIPICPEQMGGLPVPRPASEIMGGDGQAVVNGLARVVTRDGADVTDFFTRGALATLHTAHRTGAKQAVLKARSPSCGVGTIYDGSFSGRLRSGDGVTAALLRQNDIEVISDEDYLAQEGRERLNGK